MANETVGDTIQGGPSPRRAGRVQHLQTQHRFRDQMSSLLPYVAATCTSETLQFQTIISNTYLKAVSEICLLGKLIVYIS